MTGEHVSECCAARIVVRATTACTPTDAPSSGPVCSRCGHAARIATKSMPPRRLGLYGRTIRFGVGGQGDGQGEGG